MLLLLLKCNIVNRKKRIESSFAIYCKCVYVCGCILCMCKCMLKLFLCVYVRTIMYVYTCVSTLPEIQEILGLSRKFLGN